MGARARARRAPGRADPAHGRATSPTAPRTSTRATRSTALFALGAVPIVNENDATATDEIAFGDNDALAAQVAILVRARLLVLLTEVDGVYTRAPGTSGRGARARGLRSSTTPRSATASTLGRGGHAEQGHGRADGGSEAGIPTVIAGGAGDGRARADPRGRAARDAVPRRRARARPRSSSGCASRRSPSGTLHVDAGARRAVADEGEACSPSASPAARALRRRRRRRARRPGRRRVRARASPGATAVRDRRAPGGSRGRAPRPSRRVLIARGRERDDPFARPRRQPRAARDRDGVQRSRPGARARAAGPGDHPPRDRRAGLRHAAPHPRGGGSGAPRRARRTTARRPGIPELREEAARYLSRGRGASTSTRRTSSSARGRSRSSSSRSSRPAIRATRSSTRIRASRSTSRRSAGRARRRCRFRCSRSATSRSTSPTSSRGSARGRSS